MHGLIPAKLATQSQRGRKPGARLVFANVAGGVTGEIALDRRRRRLSSLARRADARRPFVLSVHRPGDTLRPQDHTVRLRAVWKETFVGHDDVVLITYLPHGGGGASGAPSTGKSIGMAVAMVALAVAAPYAIAGAAGMAAIGGLAVGTFANAAISAGLVLGGSYLMSLATRAKANTSKDDRPLYGVSGGGNLPRPGDRIPALYGRQWSQPDLSQPDYTVYDGEDQILYKRVTLGLGKYQVHTLRLGNATLWTSAGGVQAPFDASPGGDGAGEIGQGDANSGVGTFVEVIDPGDVSELVPGSVYSSPNVVGIDLPRASDSPTFSGPFLAAPLGEETARIQLDYSLPQGVFAIKRADGSDGPANWGVLFEYAPCDALGVATGPYITLHSNGSTILTKRAQRITRYVDVAEGAYLVRARNTVDWIGDHINENGFFSGKANSVFWDGLRAHFAETITRPHVTEIALRVRSGKGLGITAFADLWVEATRILPTWNGSIWTEAPTRKAVYAFKDILQSSYGGGLADGEVDLERIKFYADELSENDTFDGVIRGPVSVWEASATILGTMRAEPARIGNTWSLNRDEARAARKHVFSRRQIVRGSTAADFKIARDDGSADVIVEYAPGGDPQTRRDVRVTFGAQTVTPRRVALAGVTAHDHAHHLATWIAASAYYRRERRKISVNRQGRIVGRGDPVRIDSWFMAEARAGGVLSRSGLALTLDTPMAVGGSTYILLRNRVAEEFGPILVTADPDPTKTNVVHLDAADLAVIEDTFDQLLADVMAGDNEAMTTALVGPIEELQDGYLVHSVMPQSREVIAIEAVYDAQGVWDALGEATPPAPPIPSAGDILLPAIPEVPWVRAKCVQKAVSLEMEWAVGRARGAARYVVQVSYDDGANWETVSEDLSTSGTWALRHVSSVAIKVGAFAVSSQGLAGPAVYTEFYTFRPLATATTLELKLSALDRELRSFVLVQEEGSQVAADIAAAAFVNAFLADKAILTKVSELRTETITADEVLAQQITTVQANLNTVNGTVQAQVGVVQTLTGRVTVTEAGVVANAQATTQVSARVDANTQAIVGQASALTTLDARVTSTENGIVAVSASVTQVNARIDATNSTVGAQSSALSALVVRTESVEGVLSTQGQQITQVNSRVGAAEATVTQEINTRANQFGQVVGLWSLRVEAGNVVTGIQVLTASGEQGQILSQIAFQADKIFFKAPSGAPISVFTITPDGGTFYLRGDIVADGSIYTRHLNSESMKTLRLQSPNGKVDFNLNEGYLDIYE